MSNRIVNRINQYRYRDRNKLFADFRSGNLIEIAPGISSYLKVRSVTKNDNGKFAYTQRATFPRNLDYYTSLKKGQIGLYIGRYDGNAVVLINEGLYACPVACIKKVEGNNE